MSSACTRALRPCARMWAVCGFLRLYYVYYTGARERDVLCLGVSGCVLSSRSEVLSGLSVEHVHATGDGEAGVKV
jgi:hypothetical protein